MSGKIGRRHMGASGRGPGGLGAGGPHALRGEHLRLRHVSKVPGRHDFRRAARRVGAVNRRSSLLPAGATPGAPGLPGRGTPVVRGVQFAIPGRLRLSRNGAEGSRGRVALPGFTALTLRARSALVSGRTDFHLSADAGISREIPAASHQPTAPAREAGLEEER